MDRGSVFVAGQFQSARIGITLGPIAVAQLDTESLSVVVTRRIIT